jgi:hypothetical protein
MTRFIPTVSVRLRLLLPAALLAAGATLGGSAFGDPAIGCAAPNDEWDLEHYDACVASYKGKKYDQGWGSAPHPVLFCLRGSREH